MATPPEFNPLDYPTSLLQPEYLSGDSVAAGHVPFALTLVDLVQPKTLVEVGTHRGDIYCAFCQAVKTLELPSRCTAVGAWGADAAVSSDDAGAVLAALRGRHDPRYGGFSTLVRTGAATGEGRVEEIALATTASRFPNGSIDLLHLDGMTLRVGAQRHFMAW